ncbi:MAG TPA: hypothetical protein VKX16_08870 [Chloroflexota bacterium]|nr:hypothetical protein [Chloroflexota bacterium]
MMYLVEAPEIVRSRHEQYRREAAEDRIVRAARKARFARSGSGYRFIPVGARLFRKIDDTPCVA